MECRRVLTHIDARRTGEIHSHERHEIDEHLGTCPSCRESTTDLDQFAEMVRSLPSLSKRQILSAIRDALLDSFDAVDVDGTRIWVAFTSRGIRMIDIRSKTPAAFRNAYRTRYGRELRSGTLPPRERTAVTAAVRGESPNRCAIDLSGLTPFERDVLETLPRIPRGEVRPYAWLARVAKHPGAVRAVGNVMAHNPVPFLLPCHRVVPSEGGIGKYAFGQARKRSLLEAEGVPTGEIASLARRRIRFVGSKTTNVFCFPTCRDARRIRDENRVVFHDVHEARDNGYRPCKRCAPIAKET